MGYQYDWHMSPVVGFLILMPISAISLLIYRLYLSTLENIPGPKLAAATGWYEFYHDCWLAGKYVFEIERMHNIYGKSRVNNVVRKM